MAQKSLPKMTDVPAAERTQLLKQKMKVCAEIFDFEEPESPQRDAKRQVLLECIEYISKKNVLTEAVYADALHMVSAIITAPVSWWCKRTDGSLPWVGVRSRYAGQVVV